MKRHFTYKLLMLTLLFLGFQSESWSQYCASHFDLTSMGYINNVKFGTINNSSGGTSGGPVNYTVSAGTASVTAGTSYVLSVSNSSGSDLYITAFIDWNQNEILDDPGEAYVLLTDGSSTGPHTLSITIPFTALGGNTRMRVMLVYDEVPDPCADLTYGEAEDYQINVVTVCSPATALVGSGVAGTSATLDWEQYGVADFWEIKYGPAGFDPSTGGTTITTSTKPYVLGGLDYATEYDFYVRTTCAETGEMSIWSTKGNFITICPVPEITEYSNTERCGSGNASLSATATPGSVIRWYADAEGTDLLGTGTTFSSPAIDATTTFYVSAAYPETPCQSDPIPVTATVKPVPIIDLGNDTIICTGVSYLLDAGNPGSTYLWNTGATTQTIIADIDATYSVIVTNTFGCTASDSRTFFSSADSMIEGFNFIPLFGEHWGSVQFFPINPSELVQFYEWDFGDGSPISNEANPIHTFAKDGHYNVKLTVGNECFKASISLPISVAVTGIEVIAESNEGKFNLYPNPARDALFITQTNGATQVELVSIYDITGRMVWNAHVNNKNVIEVPVSQLSSGIYSIKIVTDSGFQVKKFEVAR
jgi:PKD repeat protein